MLCGRPRDCHNKIRQPFPSTQRKRNSFEQKQVELYWPNLARELMQNFRQISLIGLRGCFPVVHCGNTARVSDLPVIHSIDSLYPTESVNVCVPSERYQF